MLPSVPAAAPLSLYHDEIIPYPARVCQPFFPQARSALPFLPSADGKPPPIQRLAAGGEIYALPGRGMFAMTWRGQWPPSAAGECRRLAAEMPVPTGWGKRGKGTVWFPCPLLTPPPLLCAATPFGRAAKRGLRGLGSVRRAGFGTLLGPEFTLRDLQRCQCTARRCRALDLRCEKLRFHQVLYLEAPDAPVGPSLLDARPKGVAS